jgi:choline dehydrogenase-like flavoprotein
MPNRGDRLPRARSRAYGPRAMYDYVIVGAGSAGCVVAHRLGEDPDVRVAVIEAGPPDDAPEIHMPLAFGPNLTSDWDWALFSEPEPGLDHRRNYLPRGRVLGGSSSLNAMIYIRGNRADYDEWAAMGFDGWGYDDVLPYFKRAEDNERGPSRYHGVGGPLSVSDSRSMHPVVETWIEAAGQAGVPHNDDLNGATQEGAGRYQLTSATAGAAARPSPTCTRRRRAATSMCAPTRACTGSSSRASARSAWSTCATASSRRSAPSARSSSPPGATTRHSC